MRRLVAAAAAVLALVCARSVLATPGEVVLANGDVLRGDVTTTADTVVVDHAALGRVTLARASVVEVRGAAAPAPVGDRYAPYLPGEAPDTARAVAHLVGGTCDPLPLCGCPEPWKLKLGLALSLTQGNSDTFALVGDVLASRVFAPWTIKLGAAFVYQESEGDTTAERYAGLLRLERNLDARTYAFGQVLYDRDEPAGLEYRFTGTVGVGRVLHQTTESSLKGELGAGVVHEKRLGEDATTDPSAYLGLHYKREWADKRTFAADLDFTPNLGDFDLSVTRLALALGWPVSGGWKFAIGARFDYVIAPPDDRDELDVLLTAGVTYEM